jgi:hypothetical protein
MLMLFASGCELGSGRLVRSEVFRTVRMIPNVLLGDPPSAEKRVFEALQRLDLGGDWQAFHSLNCSEHEYKRWSEIDFLVVGPSGLYVLEIKGGRVAVSEGLWTFTDRWGRVHRRSEGPFRQASSAMFALEKALLKQHGLGADLRGATFGFGVMLIDVDWDVSTPEMPAEVVCDLLGFRRGLGVEAYLRRLVKYWRGKAGSKAVELDAAQLRLIKQKLRPEVDVYPPFSVRLGASKDEMLRLTDEQYDRLDMLDANDRIVVGGGAGTGKTFLMLQAARREVASERKVLVVVESSVLAAHLNTLERSEGLTIHSYAELEQGHGPREVDVLLVDEGQDLLFMDALALLSDRLRGGLDDGRWRWFMDENRQSGIAGRRDEDAQQFLLEGLTTGTPTRVLLTRNCRNTREIIETVESWTGARIGRASLLDSLGVPGIHEYTSARELADEVARVLDGLLEKGVELDEIAIIHPKGANPIAPAALPGRLAKACVPLDVNTVRAGLRNRVVVGAVDRFKGLERPVVLAVGFDLPEMTKARLAELYVATTRGNFELHLFAGKTVARELRRRARPN